LDANIDNNLKPSRPVGPQFESVPARTLTKIFPGAVGSIVLQDQTQVIKAIKN